MAGTDEREYGTDELEAGTDDVEAHGITEGPTENLADAASDESDVEAHGMLSDSPAAESPSAE